MPNITLGPLVVEAVKRSTSLPLDVHLMIENADRYIEDFAKAGADWIAVQTEACIHLNRTIHLIKENKAKAGVVLNPSTPLNALEWVLDDVDYVLIMGVNPGFGGQKFIENSLDRIRALRKMIDGRGLSTLIEVDGGVNLDTVAKVAAAGADVLVAGSAIYGSRDYKETIEKFRKAIAQALQ